MRTEDLEGRVEAAPAALVHAVVELKRNALAHLGQAPFRFVSEGSKIIFYHPTALDPALGGNDGCCAAQPQFIFDDLLAASRFSLEQGTPAAER
jgi:hypothetical protein